MSAGDRPPAGGDLDSAPTPPACTDHEGHLVAGDGLRALAALAVLAFHVFLGVAVLPSSRGQDWGPPGQLLVRLNCGLYVFFVLSGYLVGGPWVRAWLQGGGFPRPRRYAWRRVRRIVPAFWVVSAALLVAYGSRGGSPPEVLAVPAFAQVWTATPAAFALPQGWTLDVEAMFYLALPLAALLAVRGVGVPERPATRRRLLFGALALLWAGSVALRRGAPGTLEEPGARTLASFAWAFVPGLALAALEPTWRPLLAGTRAGRAVGLALGAAGLGAVAVLARFDLDDGRLATLLAYSACGGGLVGGALAWQWATGKAPPGFDSRAAHALGRWSYGIYLVHVGVGIGWVHHAPGGLGPVGLLAWVGAGTLLGSVVLAAALWRFVEAPALRGRRPQCAAAAR